MTCRKAFSWCLLFVTAQLCTGFLLSPCVSSLAQSTSGRRYSTSRFDIPALRGRKSSPQHARMLFEDFFKQGKKEEYGKFERHGNLDGLGGAFGPVGVICCGFGEDELEVLGETVESVMSGADGAQMQYVPIAVLGDEDFRRQVKLKDILTDMKERDSVLPDQAAAVSVPLVLFSGLSPLQVSAAVQAVRLSGIRGGEPGSQVAPLFAIAVPRAMEKSVGQLMEELESDAQLNDPASPPSA